MRTCAVVTFGIGNLGRSHFSMHLFLRQRLPIGRTAQPNKYSIWTLMSFFLDDKVLILAMNTFLVVGAMYSIVTLLRLIGLGFHKIYMSI